MKVVIAYIDILGARTLLWKARKFQCSQVVFKCLTVYIEDSTENGKTILGYLFHKLHDRNIIPKCIGQSTVLHIMGHLMQKTYQMEHVLVVMASTVATS